MNRNHMLPSFALLFAVALSSAGLSVPAEAAAVPPQWQNCTVVNKRFPHGLGKATARDRTSGQPVTNFRRDTRLYNVAMQLQPGAGPRQGRHCLREGMSAPQLDQYPGYFPPGSRPFWTRAKVGIAAGVAGLLVGVVGSGSEAEPVPTADSDGLAVEADLAEALDANTDLENQLEEQQGQQDQAVGDATQQAEKQAKIVQRKAVRAAVAKARSEERKKTAAAVKTARAQGLAEGRRQGAAATASTSPIAPLASTGGGTDPQYSYRYEANDAGYGPYYQGQDPEYAWYDDRDGDGVVCET